MKRKTIRVHYIVRVPHTPLIVPHIPIKFYTETTECWRELCRLNDFFGKPVYRMDNTKITVFDVERVEKESEA